MALKKIVSWTGIPPKLTAQSPLIKDGLWVGIIIAGALGLVLGVTPGLLANKMVGGKGISGPTIPQITHHDVWPKKKASETEVERFERLDLKVLGEKIPEVAAPQRTEVKESIIVEGSQQVIKKSHKPKEKTAPKRKEPPSKTNVVSEKDVALPVFVDNQEKTITKEAITPSKVKEPLLTRIRKDSSRLYVDKVFKFGNLTWEFRNATNEGIEFLVTNNENSTKTYYMPKATSEGIESIMEGAVVSPGQSVFGVIPFRNLNNRQEITLTLQAIGFGDKKVRITLPW
jgi:hypothetical protein